MKRCLLPVLIVAVAGCDIDFAAVEGAPRQGLGIVQSEHRASVHAVFDLRLSGEEVEPVVRVDGVRLSGERIKGEWRYRATPAVDTLQPSLDLEIQTADPLVVALPLVVRRGPVTWRQEGSLELPLARGESLEEWQVTWSLGLNDAGGGLLLRVNSRSPLPDTILLDGSLVPDGAAAAELEVDLQHQAEGPYPVSLTIRSTVEFAIPDSP